MNMESMLASDLMSTELVMVPPTMPVTTLARLLSDRGISSAPVTDSAGKLLGVVTEADLLRRLASAEDPAGGWLARLFGNQDRQADRYARTHGTTAQDVMTTELVTVAPDAPAQHCAHLMEEHGIKRLPVLRDGRLVGIVARADLLGAMLEPEARIGTAAKASDDRIRGAIRAEMQVQPWARSAYTFADVADGVVTLHGFVRSDALRRAFRVLAERVEGVVRVDDKMDEASFPMPGEYV